MRRSEIIELLLDEAEQARKREYEMRYLAEQVDKSATDEVAESYLKKHLWHLNFPALELALNSGNEKHGKF